MDRLIACLALTLISLAPDAGNGADRCPAGDDVDAPGVTVGFSDGSRVSYSRAPDGLTVIELNSFPDPASDFWVESWRGVYPLADGGVARGVPDRSFFAQSVYPVPLEDLPLPAPGASWSGLIKEVDSRGASLGQTTLTVNFGGVRPLVIGDCSYQAIQVETLFADDKGGFQGTLDYLPELGISIQTAGGDLGKLLDFYLPVAIGLTAETGRAAD